MAAAFFERWTDPPVSRLYIDKIFITSSRYANWEPASSIEPGDFGIHDKKTGEFLKEGSIFPHESTKECAAQKLSISDGATDHPRTLQGDLSHIPWDRLHGKHLVTEVVKCPDYCMFLSNRSACCIHPLTSGDTCDDNDRSRQPLPHSACLRATPQRPRIGWQRIGVCGVGKEGCQFTPLYRTMVRDVIDQLKSAVEYDPAPEGRLPSIPPWKPLDSDGEEEDSDVAW